MKTKSDLLGMEGMRLRVLVRSRLEEEARLREEADKLQRAKEKQERRNAFFKNASSDGKRKATRAQPLGEMAQSSSPPPS
jgi:large subunit ribosomal protein L28